MPPEEPTLTAQIDVRATLAKVDAELRAAAEIDVHQEEPEELAAPADVDDRTVAGAVAVLVASEQPPSVRRPSNTLPFVAPSDLPDGPPSSSPRAEPEPPPPPASRASSGGIADDSPVDIPGVGTPRRGMRTIVLSVLAACALVGAGALARDLWPEARKAPAPSATAAAAPTSSAAAAGAAPPSASPAAAISAATAEPSPTAAISAAPPSPSPAAAISAAPSASPAAAISAAPAAAAVAVAPTPRPAERRPPTPRPAGPAKPSTRGAIVRDAPF